MRSRALRLLLLAAAVALPAACASRGPSRPPAPAQTVTAPAAGWTEEGVASWYGGPDGFDGKPTASGEIYDSSLLTAAHRELPLGTVVDVAHLANERTVRVRINDRGPFVAGRIIDLSRAAAREVGLLGPGTGNVRVTVVTAGIPQEAYSPSGRWAVQIGSFADRLRAERHAERARGTGRLAAIFLEPYRGLSRVKVGPFDSRVEATRELEFLEEAGFEGIIVPTD